MSAKSFCSPAIWEVSTSMPVGAMSMLNLSVKNVNGIVVVKREMDTLSAAELSGRVGIRIGIRKPG